MTDTLEDRRYYYGVDLQKTDHITQASIDRGEIDRLRGALHHINNALAYHTITRTAIQLYITETLSGGEG